MFLYFDLGNVLLNFDHDKACRQLGQLTGLDPQRVRQLVFESGLELEYEAGKYTSSEFYERFCADTDTRPDYEQFVLASSEIFSVNLPMKVLLGQLASARLPLGLLSNTNVDHWNYVSQDRFGLIPSAFEQVVLSFQFGAVKPDPAIFEHAAERVNLPPSEIFYVDDTPGHVESARRVGLDAVQFTNAPALRQMLHERGLEFNG